MNRIWVNDRLSVPCPGGFKVMGVEELDRAFPSNATGRWGMWDRDRHVMLIALWQRHNPLLVWLASLKHLVKRNEQLTRQGYWENDYRLVEYFGCGVSGLYCIGYRFAYRLGDAIQRVETVLIKRRGAVYCLSCVGRDEDSEANWALFESVLDGVEVK